MGIPGSMLDEWVNVAGDSLGVVTGGVEDDDVLAVSLVLLVLLVLSALLALAVVLVESVDFFVSDVLLDSAFDEGFLDSALALVWAFAGGGSLTEATRGPTYSVNVFVTTWGF